MEKNNDDRMANDVEVESWNELIKKLYAIEKTEKNHNRYRSDFVYRGVADKSWGLETSLYRLGKDHPELDHCRKVEHPLLRSLVKYAQPGEIPSNNLWFRLAAAQHHGLPTRLLDWSLSPKVAAHFATCEEEHYDEDGAIWCVDVVEARKLLPDEFRRMLEGDAFVFSIEMLEEIKCLDKFDDLAAGKECVLFFEPPSLDGRIVNQGAIMSVMPDVCMDLKGFFVKHPSLYHRIIIPKGLKWEVRDKLDQDNVTERMLFPGIDGLCRWLKRYYGPGPNRKPSNANQEEMKPSTPAVPTRMP